MIRAIVTDIEGTTTDIAFVKNVLFPYAWQHLPEFVRRHVHEPETRRWLEDVKSKETGMDDEGAIQLLRQWIQEDRKETALKALQGMIWEDGYRKGAYRGHVYADAAHYLRRWHSEGVRLYIYSSGSVHAQKLLFGHTEEGDLNPLFSGYFDTTTGGKKEAESYRKIVAAIGLPAAEILFLSDIVEELDAARQAGMQTRWLVRDGELSADAPHLQARDFRDIG
jgi:enolase-phosphatase E1